MNVEIINVGTELLLGEIVNSNATYLQKMCRDLGFNVYYTTVVGDNPQRLLDCLNLAFQRGANCVITTGGLGPTEDDLTKELSARYLGLKMVYDEAEAKKVNDKCCFVTGLDQVSDNNFKQAYFPENCYVLDNPIGTANGCVMSKDEKMIINLPGPPKEMRYVVDHELVLYLEKYRQERIYTYDIVTQGIGESAAATLIDDIVKSQKEVSIALYASEEFVRVRLAVKARDQKQASELMADTRALICERLKGYILDDHDLLKVIMKYVDGFTIYNRCDFKLGERFINNGGEVFIQLDSEVHPLGEIVHVLLKYKEKEISFDIPLLVKASLSLPKLEAKLLSQIYQLVKRD
ncbi:damage-inducible protein CinA [[Clostridium] spiroforme]|nr:damage-inducible protein CinA [Thomasclavelia spiroformis]